MIRVRLHSKLVDYDSVLVNSLEVVSIHVYVFRIPNAFHTHDSCVDCTGITLSAACRRIGNYAHYLAMP